MFQAYLKHKLAPDTKVLIVSDIHLQLPISQEQQIIQRSLVSRINELSKSPKAILVLNGDILELWEKEDQNIEDVVLAFEDLKKAIQKFASNKNHKVIYTVGNHDDILTKSTTDRAIINKYWSAEITSVLDLTKARSVIRIEHGHEYDPYNKTSDNSKPRGKELVQKVVPVLLKTMPSLFRNIGDVVNRSLLPSFVLSNLVYKLILPIVLPLITLIIFALAFVTQDPRYIYALAVLVVISWALLIILDVILRFIASKALGGGSKYMQRVKKYSKKENVNILVCGHTHSGGINKERGFIYANSGCNDVISKPRIGWLGFYKFERYIQMSDITINESKKESIKYNQEIIPLVE